MRRFGLGREDGARLPGRVAGHPQALERPVGFRARHGGLRPGRREHVDPARRRRSTRSPTTAPTSRRGSSRATSAPTATVVDADAVGDPRGRSTPAMAARDAADDARRGRATEGTGELAQRGRELRRRRQDRHRLQGATRRHVPQRSRRARVLRQLRRLLPGRGSAGHGARLDRRAAGRRHQPLRRHRRGTGVRRTRADDRPRAGISCRPPARRRACAG